MFLVKKNRKKGCEFKKTITCRKNKGETFWFQAPYFDIIPH